MPVESIHYRDRIYDQGPGIGKKHYSKLKPAKQRRLDYLFGESGTRDAETGEIIYTTNTPTLTKGNQTNLFSPAGAEKLGEDFYQKFSNVKNPFYGLTIGDTEIPYGTDWRIPTHLLGKDYPTALLNTKKNYGGNIYQHNPAPLKTTTGGHKAITPPADYIAAYEQLGLGPMPPNAVITTADLEHFLATNYARGYELPESNTSNTSNTIISNVISKEKTPYSKIKRVHRKGRYYNADGTRREVEPAPNNYQYGGQPGSVPTTEFNAGGSHDDNPLGGIPQGMHPNGKPNLVEEGELKVTDPRNDEFFVISPKVKLDKATAEEFDLPKRYIGKDMVKIFNSVLRKESKRDGDTIEEHSKELEIAPYIDAHKKLSAEKNAEESAKEEAAFTEDMEEMVEKYPEYMQALMSQGQEQQGPSPEEQQMMEQQMMAQQQGGMPQGQPSSEEMAMMQQQGAPQQGMAPQGPPMMEHGSYMEYLNGGNIHQFSQAEGLTREQKMKMNPQLSFNQHVLKRTNPNDVGNVLATKAGTTGMQVMSAKDNVALANWNNNLQLGGDMPQQQMPQQQEQGQEIVQQVVQALQQGVAQGIEQGMSQEEATQQAAQGIMGKLVESGMPEEEAGQLLQQIMQQLQEGGQPNERPDYDRNAPSDPIAQMANGGNIYQFSQDDYLVPDPSIGSINLNPITVDPIIKDEILQENKVSPEDYDNNVNNIKTTLDAKYSELNPEAYNAWQGDWYNTQNQQVALPSYMQNYTPYIISPEYQTNKGYQNKKIKNTEKEIALKDEPKEFEFEKPLESLLKYAPVGYNLLQGMFGKRDEKSSSDYFTPISAPERNYDEFNRQIARNRAGYAKKIKQGGPTGYKSAMLAGTLKMQEQIAKVYEMTGIQEAQDKLKTDMFNATKGFEAAVTRDKFNAMSDLQQQAYLDTAFTQLGQIGDTAERNKLGLMFANLMSPDYQLTEKELLDFEKWKKEKNNKA